MQCELKWRINLRTLLVRDDNIIPESKIKRLENWFTLVEIVLLWLKELKPIVDIFFFRLLRSVIFQSQQYDVFFSLLAKLWSYFTLKVNIFSWANKRLWRTWCCTIDKSCLKVYIKKYPKRSTISVKSTQERRSQAKLDVQKSTIKHQIKGLNELKRNINQFNYCLTVS